MLEIEIRVDLAPFNGLLANALVIGQHGTYFINLLAQGEKCRNVLDNGQTIHISTGNGFLALSKNMYTTCRSQPGLNTFHYLARALPMLVILVGARPLLPLLRCCPMLPLYYLPQLHTTVPRYNCSLVQS